MRIWDDEGACLQTLPHERGVLAISVEGDVLAAGCDGGDIYTWSVSSGQQTRRLAGHSNFVYCVRLCGSLLLSGAGDKEVRLWSIPEGEEGECIASLAGHTDVVIGVALAPGGGKIASLSNALITWAPKAA